MVATSPSSPLKTTRKGPGSPVESDFSIVPHAVANRSQRREEGGFTISARAVGLYAQVRKYCHRQRRSTGGTSCEVSMRMLAAAAGVKVRQARNLRAQLVEQGILRVEMECGIHGTNRYHLVLPIPAAVEQLLPGRPARVPGPHYVVSPAQPGSSDPRQDFAAALDLGFDLALGVSDLLKPKPETENRSGAGASGPALSAADTPPAAPSRRPGAGKGQNQAVRAARRDDGRSTAGCGGRSAKTAPTNKRNDVVNITPRDTGNVIELWPRDDEKRAPYLDRFIRGKFPGIPDQVVAKTLEAWRNARLEQASGGKRVRSAWRYCTKVAARILAQAGGVPAGVSRGAGAAKPAAAVFLVPKSTTDNGPALSQGEPIADLTSVASKIDTCRHGITLDGDCRICDHTAPTSIQRILRRQQTRPGRGTIHATRIALVVTTSGSDP